MIFFSTPVILLLILQQFDFQVIVIFNIIFYFHIVDKHSYNYCLNTFLFKNEFAFMIWKSL